MNRKIVTKLLAAFLAFTLSFANVALLGIYGTSQTYAASDKLEEQEKAINKTAIEFDAYFKENEQNMHSKTIDVDGEEKLYISLKVQEGYLTNASIKIEDANFKVQESEEKAEIIQSISSEENKVVLNQIDKGETAILEIPIKLDAGSSFDVENLNKTAKITLEGEYINNKGKEIQVNKAMEVQATIDGTAEAMHTQEVSKYVTYDVGGSKGVILQTSIKSKLVDNKLPVKSTKLEIEIPEINNIEPKTIAISARSQEATNGQKAKVFNEEEYEVDDGKLTLILENDEEKLSWIKEAEDEIMLTCIYDETAITENAEIELKSSSEITYYGKEQKTAIANVEEKVELTEKIGDIVSLELGLSTNELYKGYMYKENGKNTGFTDTISLNVGYRELIDKITFKDETIYVDENGNLYPSNAIYTYTKIELENLTEILGEEGYINIYDNTGKLITTLNKDNLEYKYEEEKVGLIFETSKPIIEGILKLENGREIKPLEYAKVQLEKITEYKVSLITNIFKDNAVIIKGKDEKSIKLESPKNDAKLEISKESLSTVVKNEDVELRVTLNTTEASSLLYKNPKLEIVLPSYVKNVDVENVKLLYDTSLNITKARMYRNEAGNIVIEVTLEGEQAEYNDVAATDGATIVMNVDITADELTPTKTEKAYLNITNENAEEMTTFETDVKFVAPTGMVTVNQMSNYNDKQEKAISISGKKEVGELAINTEAKKALVSMTIINNYDYTCENIRILGRTPFVGNKSIKTGQDLGSTFTAKITSRIGATLGVNTDDITVYYSANGDATKSLEDSNNGWTTDINSLTEVKSYMIILNGASLKTGDGIGFAYNVEIPANLEHNQETYGVFTVYYTKKNEELAQNTERAMESMMIAEASKTSIRAGVAKMLAGSEDLVYEESTEAGVAGVSTGEGPNLEVTLEAKVGNQDLTSTGNVEEKSIITYIASVKNKADKEAKNVKLKVDKSDSIYFINDGRADSSIKELTFSWPEIASGETKKIAFSGLVINFANDTEEEPDTTENMDIGTNQIKMRGTATVEGYNDTFVSKVFDSRITKIQETKINLKATTNISGPLNKGAELRFSVKAGTNTEKEVENAIITCEVPYGMKVVEVFDGGAYNEVTRTITWKQEKFSAGTFSWAGQVEELPKGTFEKDLNIQFKASFDGSNGQTESEIIKRTIQKAGFSISQTTDASDGTVDVKDKIIMIITVTNKTNHTDSITLTDTLPEGFSFDEYYYTKNGELVIKRDKTGDKLSIPMTLKAGETVHINVVAQVNSLPKSATGNTATVENIVTAVGADQNEDLGGISKLPIKVVDPRKKDDNNNNNNNGNNNNNPDNPNNEVYRVSGTVWLDENKDGQRVEGEKLIRGVKVYLLDSSTNKTVSETETNEQGTYTFTNIPKGRYIVAFEYDTKAYDTTKYQADGVDTGFNSDAINKDITINGNKINCAATNAISINSNTYNIDLGLVNNPKFDMSLKKGISLVQVSNKKGTNSYRFDNTDSAQVQIEGKYMAGSVVAITYTFQIKNEGAVSGYVNKVVDYKSKELSFSSTLNPEWYQDTNGDLYNTSLAKKELKPGETAELSLILTKTMTSENTGLTNNTAELAEVSNDLGLKDINSTPGNKNTKENDFGKADIIIAVKTGGILFYGGIVLIVLAIFALGAYEINKRVLSRI